MYFVYILWSRITNRHYTGSTQDLENRLKEHNGGETTSLRSGIPWKVVHVEEFVSRREAVQREKQIKARGAKRYLGDKFRGVAQPG